MQVQLSTGALPVQAVTTGAPLAWAINDVLLATVIGTPTNDSTRLAIGNLVVTARTQLPLVDGQQLTLKVTANGSTTTLQVIDARADRATSVLTQGLARLLPKQASTTDMQELLHAVVALARDPAPVASALPAATAAVLIDHLQQLVQALPQALAVSQAQTLRHWVEQAAMPTEARLYAALLTHDAPDLTHDLRAQLARFSAQFLGEQSPSLPASSTALKQTATAPTMAAPTIETLAATPMEPATHVTLAHTTGGLKDQIESVVARLTANQLETSASTVTPLVIDLPVTRDGGCDLLHCEFEQDGRRLTDAAGGGTSVTLKLMLDGGDEFTARLHLRDDTLDLRIGASDSAFNDLLGLHLDALEQQLTAQGLAVNPIVVAPSSVPLRLPRAGHPLIDDRV